MNQELLDVQNGFRKGRGTRDQIADTRWITEKARETSTSVSLTMLKPLWIPTNCGKFLEMGLLDHPTCLLRNLYAGQKQQLELNMIQQTGSKSGKEYIKAVYCHPAYLTYMQSTS